MELVDHFRLKNVVLGWIGALQLSCHGLVGKSPGGTRRPLPVEERCTGLDWSSSAQLSRTRRYTNVVPFFVGREKVFVY